jgi:iron complex outermembrane receptor protein
MLLQPLPAYTRSEEELLFQEIPSVFGASKYEQKVTEAPSSVSIVTADEIKKYGYRTLADLLHSIRGFYVTNDRMYDYAGVRGFGRPGDYNTRLLLLVNGYRINDALYDYASIGTDFPIDVDIIDRVEVIRGPSSSIYGTSAFFGVINVITKKGRDLKGTEVSLEAASYETYKGRLSCGKRFENGLEILFSGSVYDGSGQDLYFKEFDDPSTNNGIAEDGDYSKYHTLFLRTSFHDFTLEGAYSSREKGMPTAAWGVPFNDPRNKMFDAHCHLNLEYVHRFPNQFDVLARIYYGRYHFIGDYLDDYADVGEPPLLVIYKEDEIGEWLGGELQLTKRLFGKHKFVLGAKYQDNFRQDMRGYDDFFDWVDVKKNSRYWAVYIQDEFQVLTHLTVNAGMRYDFYETFGSTTNPRLALIYNPIAKTTLKLIYGKAFRAPNTYELYFNDGDDSVKANPDLEPETIKTYELILEQYVGGHLRGTATGFYYNIKNLITHQIDPADDLLVFNNVEEIAAKGLELELEGKWPNGVGGRISYTYQETEDRQTGNVLTNSPRHLAKFNLVVPLLKEKVFAGVEVQHMSKRKTLAGEYSDGFFVANMTLFSNNLLKGLEFSASVYNLLDKKYGDPGSTEHLQDVLERDGRHFRLKLTYSF